VDKKESNIYDDEEFQELKKKWFEEIKAIHLSSEFQKDNDDYYREMTNISPNRLFKKYTI